MRPFPLSLLVGCIGACATQPTETTDPFAGCDDAGEASLEVGTGTAAFEPLTPDGPIGFYPGPQGGHHVWVSVRAEGILPGLPSNLGYDDPILSVSVVTDRELSIYQDQQRRFDQDGDVLQLVGQLVRLVHKDPVVFDGDPVTLSVDIEDRCGSQASSTMDLILELGEE